MHDPGAHPPGYGGQRWSLADAAHGPHDAFGRARPRDCNAVRNAGDFSGFGPRIEGRSDQRIREDICERLSNDPLIDPSEVEVQCKNGRVSLNGRIRDRRLKHRIENIVAGCLGVTAIDNRIHVVRDAG